MKKILALSLVLSSFSMLFAQNSSSDLGTNDPEAKKILEAVTAKFKSYSSVKAAFSLKIENSAGKVQGEKKGTA